MASDRAQRVAAGGTSRTVGPRLRLVLRLVLVLMALLLVNSAYLAGITFLEWWQAESYQDHFYQYMFLGHLVLGLVLVLPLAGFVLGHMRHARLLPNRRAAALGYGLAGACAILVATGLGLLRVEGFEIRHPDLRTLLYWLHVLAPLAVVGLFLLHRLHGPRVRWRRGLYGAAALAGTVAVMVFLHSRDPRHWNRVGPGEGVRYFEPSLARTASGHFIPAETLMMDEYCRECHPDAYEGWFHSAHRFSSFNNEPYLFSVRETREMLLERDGDVKASRWCAGCHDVVPFLSGAFDDPDFDMENHPTAHAGITCTVCHAITHVNSPRGNADYTIEEPLHYPFARSDNPLLRYVNRQLVKANPDFHRKTFLKPLHRTGEFCSTCHKVSLPGELTGYRSWLRGQNHYDSFLLSGVSGGNAKSFYYPHKAQANCNGCHMPLQPSGDFGAARFGETAGLSIHSHLFPGGNTAIPAFAGDAGALAVQQEFLRRSLRIDIFGLREDGRIDGVLHAPLRPLTPPLEAGREYLLEVVLRTLGVGHAFTQGTADSNQVWVEVVVRSEGRVVGRSGGMNERREIDPWSHFVNIYMLDREGNRIDRRNAADIFTPLYDHQIPPGAADVLHYRLAVPEGQEADLEVEARVLHRKFDSIYMRHVFGPDHINRLPITEIARDRLVLPMGGGSTTAGGIPPWERWNDYGIGLLLVEGGKGQLAQAEEAFRRVEALGRPDGPLNLARVYLREGRVAQATGALGRAARFDPPAPRWTLAWLSALVNRQNGRFDDAVRDLRSILESGYPERGLDFSRDYQVRNELGLTYLAMSPVLRPRPGEYERILRLAIDSFTETLALDPENVTAHHNLSILHALLGEEERAAHHRDLHDRYRIDDNARDRVVALARERDPAARHASQPVTIHDLHREGAFGR